MGYGKSNTKFNTQKSNGSGNTITIPLKRIDSLLDNMVDGREYESIIGIVTQPNIALNINIVEELKRAIGDISKVRKRPLICYIANITNAALPGSRSIEQIDDLPFSEMVSMVPPQAKEIDVLIVTPGGSAEQVARFVNHLRPRFDKVSFIIPSMAMSAGTIWAMSGDEIIMDSRATIGPIDPQVRGVDGNFVSAQSVLTLIKEIQARGEELIAKGQSPLWTDFQILNRIDAKEIGSAVNSSDYSIELVTDYLYSYKFKDWDVHSDGRKVKDEEKRDRAQTIAKNLCDHGQWKTHSRGITREVAWDVCNIKITHPENIDGLARTIRRFWAFLYWTFENANFYKMFISENYTIFKASQIRNNNQNG